MITQNEISKKMALMLHNRIGENLKKVILFGSMARRDNSLESDYDCIAVVDEITPELMDAIDEVSGEMLYDYNSVFSIIPVTLERYNNQRYNPLLINAGREGIVLWQTAV